MATFCYVTTRQCRFSLPFAIALYMAVLSIMHVS